MIGSALDANLVEIMGFLSNAYNSSIKKKKRKWGITNWSYYKQIFTHQFKRWTTNFIIWQFNEIEFGPEEQWNKRKFVLKFKIDGR